MASCCGASTILIRAGQGIVVAGSGTPTDPYVVTNDAALLSSVMQVRDTSSVNLTTFGLGTPEDPFILQADASIAMGDLTDVQDPSGPVNGDVLTWVTDHWEFRPPPPAPAGAVNVENGLRGLGSVEEPIGVKTSGTWGQAPLDTLGPDSTVGLAVYVDSNGDLRAQPPTETAVEWSAIVGKPSTFTPSTHQHGWSEITGKPTAFTPTQHSHSASEITNPLALSVGDSQKIGGRVIRVSATDPGGANGDIWLKPV